MAPVFDTADQILVVESDDGRLVSQSRETLPADDPLGKVARVAELGVETLVCGAVSRELQERLTAGGIRFIPFVAGELQEVVAAWREGRLANLAFSMPGCGRGRRNRGGRGRGAGMRGRRFGGCGAADGAEPIGPQPMN